MSKTEEDIFLSHVEAGWVGDRPCLNNEQKDELIDLLYIKPLGQDREKLSNRLNNIYSDLMIGLGDFQEKSILVSKYDKRSRYPKKIRTLVSREIKIILDKFPDKPEILEDALTITINVIEEELVNQGFKKDNFEYYIDASLDDRNAFFYMLSKLELTPNTGSNVFLFRQYILSLASLYEDFTGIEPKRAFSSDNVAANTKGKGEVGAFLEFVKAFMSFIPKEYIPQENTSFVKIVRSVLNDDYKKK